MSVLWLQLSTGEEGIGSFKLIISPITNADASGFKEGVDMHPLDRELNGVAGEKMNVS